MAGKGRLKGKVAGYCVKSRYQVSVGRGKVEVEEAGRPNEM